MKRLKKVLCGVLSLLLLAAFPVSTVATETDDPLTPYANLNDALVSWWNFAGDGTACLQDKAVNGGTADALTVAGGDTAVKDGVASVPHTMGSYISFPSSTDLTDVTSMTVYLKAKYTGSNTDFADLIAFNNLYRIYKLADSASGNGAVFEASAFATSGSTRIRPQSNTAVEVGQDQWFYIALTMEIDSDNQGRAALYLSTDGIHYTGNETYSGSTTSLSFTADAIEALKAKTSKVVFGKTNTTAADRGISYTFDDVRIYNKALTASELAAINMPTCIGYQVKDDTEAEGVYSLRFLATLNSLDFSEVGFEITASYGTSEKQFVKNCRYVYQAVNATGECVTAESRGGNYLIALAITGIPDDIGEVTYTIRPYAKSGSDAAPIYGASATVVHNIAS